LLPRVSRLPQGTDPDELARQHGIAAVQRVLDGSRPLLEYLIDMALRSGFASDDAQARAAKIREIKALIDQEEDPLVREMVSRYASEEAARKFGIGTGDGDARGLRTLLSAVSGDALRQDPSRREEGRREDARNEAPRPAQPAPSKTSAPPERARSPSRVDAIRDQVLGAALEYPDLLQEPEIVALLEVVDGPLALGLIVIQRLSSRDASAQAALRADPPALLAEFPEPLRPQVALRLVAPQLSSRDAAREVLSENLAKLRRQSRNRELSSMQDELRRLADSGDLDAQFELLKRRSEQARAKHRLD